MQGQRFGGIGDLIKLAFLRHLMEGRRLAVCWYFSEQKERRSLQEKHFSYLQRPDEFRHLAPEIFDTLKAIVDRRLPDSNYVAALQASGLLAGAPFHCEKVPKKLRLRRDWATGLVDWVDDANLIFLDPENGIQGKRLTPKHVALSEIAALRSRDRALITVQRQSGRRLEAKFIADQLKSIGCDRLELVRFRLVASRFYVVFDHDDVLSERISSFARKWGDWVRTYHP